MKLVGVGLVAVCLGGLGTFAPPVSGEPLELSGEARVQVDVAADHLVLRALEPCERMTVTVRGPGDYWKRDVVGGEAAARFELGTDDAPAQAGDYTIELRLFGELSQEAGRAPRVAWGRFGLGERRLPAAEGAPQTRVPYADVTISDPTPQLVFQDTDASAVDWQVHSVGNGATFGIQNMASGSSPVTVDSSAPANALYVTGGGSGPAVGIGTVTPVAKLHVVAGVPNIGLESSTSGHLWLLAQTGQGLAVTDDPASTHTPLFILNDAPGRSLQIDSTGNLAAFADEQAGTNGASASLHVRRANGTARLLVEETNGTVIGRNMLQTRNNGPSTFRFDNTASGQSWGFGSLNSGNFFVGSTPGQPLAMTLTAAGNLSITGTLAQGSDRDSKTDVADADARAVLEKMAELKVSTWRYKGDEALHVGPMAQDFAALFGLGADDKHIAPGDMAGLAFAAIQALREDALSKDARIHELEGRLRALEASRARD